MLRLKTKRELADEAYRLSSALQLVRYRNATYIPADYETGRTDSTPPDDRKIWLPLTRRDIQQMAAAQFDTMFASDSELSSFEFMLAQGAEIIDTVVSSLLVRTENGLTELDRQGQLLPVTGEFRPNTLRPMLNQDPAVKQMVYDVFLDWLQSDEEADSLLAHLATSLAPGWSAVKYVLLLGQGRNGKSLLMKMLMAVFGSENCSNITRQMISEQSPAVIDLSNKLLNLVFDGKAEFLKDSGTEKSLIAGEPVPIRKLYESTATRVQTNALFIEGLNKEPKTSDKSSALQKRISRFQFGQTYPLNHVFEKQMLADETLGAFLALLIDHYVQEDHVAERLQQTTRGRELEAEQLFANSYNIQFLKHLQDTNPAGAAAILGLTYEELTNMFRSWRLKNNDLRSWPEPDVTEMFKPLLVTDRKTKSTPAGPRKVRVIMAFTLETQRLLDTLEGADTDEAFIAAMVDE